uniref:Uncharacterized protein n=1 Tax=Rhizophora mucronata TaxID=61149 RepID=A0A2P2PDT6_RHIMU
MSTYPFLAVYIHIVTIPKIIEKFVL